MDIFDSIEKNNFEEVKNQVENGANIYKTRNFRFDSSLSMPSDLYMQYCRFYPYLYYNETELELPLTNSIIFNESDEIANYLLDIYERDLEVLKGTNYKKALVAMPEDQSEELLSCCTFSIPNDEKFFEPVLLKKNNLEPPRLAFLCRKLKDKNDQSLKFIHKLEKNGLCDLSLKLPARDTKDSILHILIRAEKHEIAKRIFDSPFIDENLKQEVTDEFCCTLASCTKIQGFEHIFVNFHFYERFLTYFIASDHPYGVEFIIKSMMKQRNCTLSDIYKLDGSLGYDSTISGHTVLHEILACKFYEKLNLPYCEDDLCLDNDDSMENLIKNVLYNYSVAERRKFIEKFPNILKIKSNENFGILHYAIMNGDVEFIKEIYDMVDDENIFLKNKSTAVKCLEISVNFFNNKEEVIVEILKLLLKESYESFMSENGHKILKSILINSYDINMLYKFLKLPSFDAKIKNKVSVLQVIYICINSYDSLKYFMSHYEINDWNVEDFNGKTLFMKACKFTTDNSEFLKSIIEKQPDCGHQKSSNGSSCLHFVADHSTNEMAKLFVKLGVDPHTMNAYGQTAIVQAGMNHGIFSYLLQFESNESFRTKYRLCKSHPMISSENLVLLIQRNFDIPEDCHLFECFEQIKSGKINIDHNQRSKMAYKILMEVTPDHNPENLRNVLRYFKNDIDFSLCGENSGTFTDAVMNLYPCSFPKKFLGS